MSTDIQVQVYGDMAVLVGLDTVSGKNKSGPYVSKWLCMNVWIKRDGRWQCVKTIVPGERLLFSGIIQCPHDGHWQLVDSLGLL